MKRMTVYHTVWVAVGCFFAEAAFLLIQILLTVLFLRVHYSLPELLSANNPFYALPLHFYIISIVFLVSVLYGELRRIRFLPYYIGCSLLTTGAFHVALFLSGGDVMQASAVVINLIAAAISGLVYWAVSPRRKL